MAQSLSYSSRRLQCSFPCIERPITGYSYCPITPEDFNAQFSVQRALSAGLVPVLYLQKSSMHISLYRAPYQGVQSVSYSSRSFQCTVLCIECPLSASISVLFLQMFSKYISLYRAPYQQSSPCPINPEGFNAHFPVQNTHSAGLFPDIFPQKSSMYNSLYRLHYQQVQYTPLYKAPYKDVHPSPIPPEFFNAHSHVQNPLTAGLGPYYSSRALNAHFPVQRIISAGLSVSNSSISFF